MSLRIREGTIAIVGPAGRDAFCTCTITMPAESDGLNDGNLRDEVENMDFAAQR